MLCDSLGQGLSPGSCGMSAVYLYHNSAWLTDPNKDLGILKCKMKCEPLRLSMLLEVFGFGFKRLDL